MSLKLESINEKSRESFTPLNALFHQLAKYFYFFFFFGWLDGGGAFIVLLLMDFDSNVSGGRVAILIDFIDCCRFVFKFL